MAWSSRSIHVIPHTDSLISPALMKLRLSQFRWTRERSAICALDVENIQVPVQRIEEHLYRYTIHSLVVEFSRHSWLLSMLLGVLTEELT
jgi:hypothetical protein